MSVGFAAAAVLLCLLSSALPAYLAGDRRSALIAIGLFSCAVAAALAAWGCRRGSQPSRPEALARSSELRLMATAASTLRDALATIHGFSDLLARGGQPPAQACRFILDSCEDLMRYCGNLQAFVHSEQERLTLVEEQVDAAELASSALGPLLRSAERADVVVEARVVDGVELRCDPARLRRALANIVHWAVDSASAGSKITVVLKSGGAAPSFDIDVVVDPARRLDMAEPRDVGDGIAGFALPVAWRLARMHGGDLTVGSTGGGRMTLSLSLPPDRVISPQQGKACERRAA